MASVGPKLTIPFIVGAGQIVGQGNLPEFWCVYTTDDASVASPAWLDASSLLRGGSTSRGRENELSEFDAGTATLVLDNRTRTFDPNSNALIKPMNRWWLREQFSGETQDLFKGYAESYTQGWQDPSMVDATTTVQCADEFKVLSLAALPVSNPPRDSYAELIATDAPVGYWDMNDDSAARQRIPTEIVNAPTPVPDDPVYGLRRADRRQAPSRPRKK